MQDQEHQQQKNQPASRIEQFFPITAAIWRNQTVSEATGEVSVWYSVTFQRHYRDGQGNRKHTDSYSGDDLLVLAKVSDLAHTEISRLRASDRRRQEEGREPGAEG